MAEGVSKPGRHPCGGEQGQGRQEAVAPQQGPQEGGCPGNGTVRLLRGKMTMDPSPEPPVYPGGGAGRWEVCHEKGTWVVCLGDVLVRVRVCENAGMFIIWGACERERRRRLWGQDRAYVGPQMPVSFRRVESRVGLKVSGLQGEGQLCPLEARRGTCARMNPKHEAVLHLHGCVLKPSF